MNPVIPESVPVPLPAPPWLPQLLMVFTFILHLVAMNWLVGGSTLLALSSFLGRANPRHRELARRGSQLMPPVVAFTITLGVAPLLFLQLVYGQLFFTSSILMAWAWLSVVLLLMLGYYGIYWFTLQHEELGPRGGWVMLGTALIFVVIMMVFVQNLSLMQRPADFYPTFLSGKVGSSLGRYDSVTLARYFHFLVAAVAIAGLGLALASRLWKSEAAEFAAWAERYGLIWFAAGTGVQFLVGFWFLLSLPTEIRRIFLGGDALATALLVVAVTLAVLALLAALRSMAAATFAIFGTIALMAVIRHLVRTAYLKPHFDPRTLPVEGQWVVFGIFAVLLLVGIGTVAWMLFHFFRPAGGVQTT